MDKKKTSSALSWIALIGFIGLIGLGFVFGPDELKGKMGAAGLVAAITGIPALIYNMLVGKNSDDQKNGALELSDNAWAKKVDYGYTKKMGITVKSIDEYMSQLTRKNAVQISWSKGASESVSCKNYDYKETVVTIVRVRVNGEVQQAMYFIEGCKENSKNAPKSYIKKEKSTTNTVTDNVTQNQQKGDIYAKADIDTDESVDNNLSKTDDLAALKLESSADGETTIKARKCGTKDPANSTSIEIPAEMLRKLKVLYDQEVLTEEEFSEKKKQLLGI